jgi:hypothetical protein
VNLRQDDLVNRSDRLCPVIKSVSWAKLFASASRSLIDTKATSIRTLELDIDALREHPVIGEAPSSARMIRGSGLGAWITLRAAPSTRDSPWAVPLYL